MRPVNSAAQAIRARGLPLHAFMHAGNISRGGRAAFVTGEQAGKEALADGYQAGLRVVAPSAQRQTGPVVSVVIPSCDRPALLLRCLDALLTQERVGGEIEIIVVDDARSAEQEALLTSFLHTAGAGQLVRYLRQPDGAHGPAAARNTGWRSAQAEIIAFTDDDTIPAHDWLCEGLHGMRSGAAALWGDVIVPLSEAPTDAERNTGTRDGAEFVTANCFVRREALELVGGFDQRFERPWREGSDLYFMLLEAGCTVLPCPAAIVIHPTRPALPGSSVRQNRNLLFEALLYKKHPRLYREKISPTPPFHHYATVIATLITVVGLVTGAPTPAAAGAMGWALLTARLAARRLRGTSRSVSNVADIVFSSVIIPFVAVYWRLAGALRFRVLFA